MSINRAAARWKVPSVSIGKKFLIAVTAMVIFALLTTLLFSLVIFRSSFLNLERQNLESNVKRVTNTLSASIDNLSMDTQDRATSDDTYHFAMDGNDDYIKNNFGDQVFERKKLNLIIVLDKDGKIVDGKAYDLNKHQEIEIPQESYSYVSAGIFANPSDTSPGTKGIILLSILL